MCVVGFFVFFFFPLRSSFDVIKSFFFLFHSVLVFILKAALLIGKFKNIPLPYVVLPSFLLVLTFSLFNSSVPVAVCFLCYSRM